jgi:2-polyprenyl-3-methyl-5-hydroxy-6-metoxy-1,4-benzoquinol methylase
MKNIYTDGTYFANNPTWDLGDSAWKAKQILGLIGKNKLTPKAICEVGCGAGEILNQLSLQMKEGVSFTGYEISPQAFGLCRSKEKSNLKFYLNNLLEEPDVLFDIVMAIDVIEHVEDYFGFLRRLKKYGKYKIFHIPLELSAQSVLRSYPIIKARLVTGHLHYFTKEIALAALVDSGYRVIDYSYTAGSVELPNRRWRTTLLKIPRKLCFLINQDFAARILGGWSLLVLAE